MLVLFLLRIAPGSTGLVAAATLLSISRVIEHPSQFPNQSAIGQGRLQNASYSCVCDFEMPTTNAAQLHENNSSQTTASCVWHDQDAIHCPKKHLLELSKRAGSARGLVRGLWRIDVCVLASCASCVHSWTGHQ